MNRTLACATKLLAVASGLVGLAGLAAPRAAWAQEAPRFGDRGQLIVSADRLFSAVGYTAQSITATEGATTTTTEDSGASIALLLGREPSLGTVHTIPRVAFDVTVVRGLTLGTSLAFAIDVAGTHTEERRPSEAPKTTRETRSPRASLLGFAPRVGYVLPLGSSLSFWPRAGLAFYSMTSRSEQTSNLGAASTTTVTDTHFSLDLDPQLVWTPLSHVLVHAGPLVNVPLAGAHETAFAQGADSKDRSDDLSVFHVGLSVGVGAWFDL